MKLKGTNLFNERAVGQVSLARPDKIINLTIRALPLGFEELVLQRLPPPRPPKKFMMKEGKVLRDERGVPYQELDVENPAFRKAVTHISFLQMIAMVHEALKGDPEVSWETIEPKDDAGAGWQAFYEGILGEMRAQNLSTGDIKKIVNKVMQLSGVREEDITEARERFLSGGESDLEVP